LSHEHDSAALALTPQRPVKIEHTAMDMTSNLFTTSSGARKAVNKTSQPPMKGVTASCACQFDIR